MLKYVDLQTGNVDLRTLVDSVSIGVPDGLVSVVDWVHDFLQDGLLANRAIGGTPWSIVRAMGRAFRVRLQQSISAVQSIAGTDEECAIRMWIARAALDGALVELLRQLPSQAHILSAYGPDARVRDKEAVLRMIDTLQTLQGLVSEQPSLVAGPATTALLGTASPSPAVPRAVMPADRVQLQDAAADSTPDSVASDAAQPPRPPTLATTAVTSAASPGLHGETGVVVEAGEMHIETEADVMGRRKAAQEQQAARGKIPWDALRGMRFGQQQPAATAAAAAAAVEQPPALPPPAGQATGQVVGQQQPGVRDAMGKLAVGVDAWVMRHLPVSVLSKVGVPGSSTRSIASNAPTPATGNDGALIAPEGLDSTLAVIDGSASAADASAAAAAVTGQGTSVAQTCPADATASSDAVSPVLVSGPDVVVPPETTSTNVSIAVAAPASTAAASTAAVATAASTTLYGGMQAASASLGAAAANALASASTTSTVAATTAFAQSTLNYWGSSLAAVAPSHLGGALASIVPAQWGAGRSAATAKAEASAATAATVAAAAAPSSTTPTLLSQPMPSGNSSDATEGAGGSSAAIFSESVVGGGTVDGSAIQVRAAADAGGTGGADGAGGTSGEATRADHGDGAATSRPRQAHDPPSLLEDLGASIPLPASTAGEGGRHLAVQASLELLAQPSDDGRLLSLHVSVVPETPLGNIQTATSTAHATANGGGHMANSAALGSWMYGTAVGAVRQLGDASAWYSRLPAWQPAAAATSSAKPAAVTAATGTGAADAAATAVGSPSDDDEADSFLEDIRQVLTGGGAYGDERGASGTCGTVGSSVADCTVAIADSIGGHVSPQRRAAAAQPVPLNGTSAAVAHQDCTVAGPVGQPSGQATPFVGLHAPAGDCGASATTADAAAQGSPATPSRPSPRASSHVGGVSSMHVVSTSTGTDPHSHQPFTAYVIEAHAHDGRTWQVPRRFSELLALRTTLKAFLSTPGVGSGGGGAAVSELPASWDELGRARAVLGGAKMAADVVQSRSSLLERCIRDVLATGRPLAAAPALLHFLGAPADMLVNAHQPPSGTAGDISPDRRRRSSSSGGGGGGITVRLQVEAPSRRGERQQYEVQAGRCAGCQGALPPVPASAAKVSPRAKASAAAAQPAGAAPRLCHYTGRLFCGDCHSGQLSMLPWRVLHQWDFAALPVCHVVHEFLDSVVDQPLLCVTAVAPELYERVPALAQARDLRAEISRRLAQASRLEGGAVRAAQLRGLAGTRAYMLEGQADFWSLKDLVDIHQPPSQLLAWLQSMLQQATLLCASPRDVGA